MELGEEILTVIWLTSGEFEIAPAAAAPTFSSGESTIIEEDKLGGGLRSKALEKQTGGREET